MCLYAPVTLPLLFSFCALPVFKSESAAHKQEDKPGQPASQPFPSATLGVSVSVCLHGSRRGFAQLLASGEVDGHMWRSRI